MFRLPPRSTRTDALFPYTTLFRSSNDLPVSRDTTRGFIRRWLVLDFNHPIREEDKIENLAQILVAEERGAIAAWALEGLHRLLDNRDYTTPSCHEQRLAQRSEERRVRKECVSTCSSRWCLTH